MRIQDPEAAPVLPALVVGLPRRRATGRLNAAETSLLRVLEDAELGQEMGLGKFRERKNPKAEKEGRTVEIRK